MAGPRVAVVGAGIVGLATARALSERGADVRVYERGVPGNGQSGGRSRIFRHAHDDPRLVRMAADARAIWRGWEDAFGVELISRDGALALGPDVGAKCETMRSAGYRDAGEIDAAEVAARQPALAAYDGDAMFDPGGGSIRTEDAIRLLGSDLEREGRLIRDEVIALRALPDGDAELRSGGETARYDHVVVCAGQGTVGLAATLGLALPVKTAAHVRLTFAVRGPRPERLACLQDSSGLWGETGIYGAPLPGNAAFGLGLSDTTEARPDGALVEPLDLAALADRARDYVERALPGLDPDPVDVRHCWVTQLPWSSDGVAAWRAGSVTLVAGHNLFKQAPALGAALAAVACGEERPFHLAPEARLGAA